jgi:hypothetical protein
MFSPVRRFWLVLLLNAGGALLSGCGAHFHDAGRDATAQAAKASYEEARVLDIIVAERANLDKLLRLELGVAGRHLDTVLRAEWFRLVDSKNPLGTSLMERGVGRRLTQLGLPAADDAAANDVLATAATLKVVSGALTSGKAIEAARTIRLRFKVDPPPCDDPAVKSETVPSALAAAAKDRPEAMKALWDEYRQACAPSSGDVPGGALRRAFDEMQGVRDRIRRDRERQQQAGMAFEQALKEFEAAASPVPAGIEEFNRKVESLRALLDQAATQAGALGVETAAAERLRSLDVLLRATAGGKVDAGTLADPEVKKAVMVVATSRALTDEARSIAASRRAPPVSALLIEKQRQEALRAAAARRVDRGERRLQLHEDRFEALVHEVYLLQRARVAAKAAALAAPADDPFGRPLASALSAGDVVARRLTYQTLFHYLDSIATARRRQEEADYRLIALDHEEAVDASETAIALWNGLIATPVNELAAYHAAGLKAEQIAALLVQFVTLGSIGVGVNR